MLIFESLTMVCYVLIAFILLFASIEDIYHRTIGKWKVVLIFILVICINIMTDNFNPEATSMFLLVSGSFIGISLISFGGFGMGDALVIGALGWAMADFEALQGFLFAIGLISLIWAVFWVFWLFRKNGYSDFVKGIKQIQVLPVDKLRAGMVLAEDNFMHGLTLEDIDKIKDRGVKWIKIKQPLPFIPVIFVAYLFTIFF